MPVAVTFQQLRCAWIFLLCNIFTPAVATHVNSLLGYPLSVLPLGVSTSLNFRVAPSPSKGKPPREVTLTPDLWPQQPPTLLTEHLPCALVGWGRCAHYQVSVITPSRKQTDLIYGDCGTCVPAVGVDSFCLFHYGENYTLCSLYFIFPKPHFAHFCVFVLCALCGFYEIYILPKIK